MYRYKDIYIYVMYINIHISYYICMLYVYVKIIYYVYTIYIYILNVVCFTHHVLLISVYKMLHVGAKEEKMTRPFETNLENHLRHAHNL